MDTLTARFSSAAALQQSTEQRARHKIFLVRVCSLNPHPFPEGEGIDRQWFDLLTTGGKSKITQRFCIGLIGILASPGFSTG
jgi:hypothetical protein